MDHYTLWANVWIAVAWWWSKWYLSWQIILINWSKIKIEQSLITNLLEFLSVILLYQSQDSWNTQILWTRYVIRSQTFIIYYLLHLNSFYHINQMVGILIIYQYWRIAILLWTANFILRKRVYWEINKICISAHHYRLVRIYQGSGSWEESDAQRHLG